MDWIVIATLVGLIISAIAALAALVVVPEVRQWLRLKEVSSQAKDGVGKATLVVKDIPDYLFNLSSLYARTTDFTYLVPNGQNSFVYFGREAWSVSSDDDVVVNGHRCVGPKKRGSIPKLLLTSQTGAVITGAAIHVDRYAPPPPPPTNCRHRKQLWCWYWPCSWH